MSRYGVVVKFAIHAKMDKMVLWTDDQIQNQNHFTEPKNFKSGGILGDFLLQPRNRDEKTFMCGHKDIYLVEGGQKNHPETSEVLKYKKKQTKVCFRFNIIYKK